MQNNNDDSTLEEKFEILFQDNDIIVINKAANLLSVPGRLPENFDSVELRIQKYFPDAMMAHRLDRDTSGIITVALHKEALKGMQRQFQDRLVSKQYIAVVDGIINQEEGKVELPIRCDWPNRPRQMVCYEHGKDSLTHYSVISRDSIENSTRVLLTPITGRTHQLRVHMNEASHPILGCNLYKNSESEQKSNRLLLHASQITFKHPISEIPITLKSAPEF